MSLFDPKQNCWGDEIERLNRLSLPLIRLLDLFVVAIFSNMTSIFWYQKLPLKVENNIWPDIYKPTCYEIITGDV